MVEHEVERVLLDRRSAAKALSVSMSTFERMRTEGLPVIRVPGGRKPLFDPIACKTWMIEYNNRETEHERLARQHLDTVLA